MPKPGFGIYIHWPFCLAKCPYCDFNSHVRHHGVDHEGFTKALIRELTTMSDLLDEQCVTSIFFGGGTPSLMLPSSVSAILETVAKLWQVDTNVEVTLEANPTSVESKRLHGYHAAGVNRISLGIQALNDRDLAALGRTHSAGEALAAIANAQSVFDNVSFDLIYARPGQLIDSWKQELQEALQLGPHHMSLYQLTIEQGTPFAALHAAGKLVIPIDDLAADLYEMTFDLCAEAGLQAYEISNYAKPGTECRHNLTYWRGGDYIGIGPGAHGRLTRNGICYATLCERHPETWLKAVEHSGHGLIENNPLRQVERADEILLMGLRLAEGLDLQRYLQMSDRRFNPQTIKELIDLGLIEYSPPHILRVCPSGFPVLDTVITRLAGD